MVQTKELELELLGKVTLITESYSEGSKEHFIKEFWITPVQLTLTCSKSSIETLEKGVKYVQS